MEINNEKFSLVKLASGFGNIGKILFVLILFIAFSWGKDYFIPRIRKSFEIQHVENYIEAPDQQPLKYVGLKIGRFGIGAFYE